jgi:hypothetical protein
MANQWSKTLTIGGERVKSACVCAEGKQTIQIGTRGFKVPLVGPFKMTITEMQQFTDIPSLIKEINERLVRSAEYTIKLMGTQSKTRRTFRRRVQSTTTPAV